MTKRILFALALASLLRFGYAADPLPVIWKKTERLRAPGGNINPLKQLVDPQGNVFVIAKVVQFTNQDDDQTELVVVLRKYAADNGTLIWEKYYDGAFTDAAVDQQGNLLILNAATIPTYNNGKVFPSIRVFSGVDGEVLEKSYATAYTDIDLTPLALAIGPSDDLVLATSYVSNGRTTFEVRKLAGTDLTRICRFGFSVTYIGDVPRVRALTISPGGDLLTVVGMPTNVRTADAALRVNGQTGAEVWFKYLTNGSRFARILNNAVFDASGNLVYSGYFDYGTDEPSVLRLPYSGTGGWSVDTPGLKPSEILVKPDSNGDVFLFGRDKVSDPTALVARKLAGNNGSVIWQNTYTDVLASSIGDETFGRYAIDSTGCAALRIRSGAQQYSIRLSGSDGRVLWRNNQVDGSVGEGLLPDGSGNPILLTAKGGYKVSIQKSKAADGSVAWTRVWETDQAINESGVTGDQLDSVEVAPLVDSNGDVLTLTKTQGTASGSPGSRLVKRSGLSGDVLWTWVPTDSPEGVVGEPIVVRATGNDFMVAVSARKPSGLLFTRVAKVRGTDGSTIWVSDEFRSVDPSGQMFSALCRDLNVGLDGTVYAAGYDSEGAFLTHLDGGDGRLLWRSKWSPSTSSVGIRVFSDASGDVYTVGPYANADTGEAGVEVGKYASGDGTNLWNKHWLSPRWSTGTYAQFSGSASVQSAPPSALFVAFGSSNGFVVLNCNASTGSELWRRDFSLENSPVGAPFGSNGIAFQTKTALASNGDFLVAQRYFGLGLSDSGKFAGGLRLARYRGGNGEILWETTPAIQEGFGYGSMVFDQAGGLIAARAPNTLGGQLEILRFSPSTGEQVGSGVVSFPDGEVAGYMALRGGTDVVFQGVRYSSDTARSQSLVTRIQLPNVARIFSKNLALTAAPRGTGSSVEGEQIGTTYANAEIPAVDSVSGVAFRGTYLPAGAKKASAAVFAGSPPRILARAGDAAIGAEPATFKSFGDPLLSASGVAFSAKLSDGRTGVWATALGSGLQLVAITGGEAPGISGSKIASILSFSLRGGELAALSKLKPGFGGVTAASDTTLVRFANGAKSLLLQTGQPITIPGFEASKVTKISAFTPSPECPGQDRSHAEGMVAVRVTLASKREVALAVAADGSITPRAYTGTQFASDTQIKTVGLPGAGSPQYVGLKQVLKPFRDPNPQPGVDSNVDATNDEQLQAYQTGSLLTYGADERDETAEDADVKYGSFSDPAINDQGTLAYLAKLVGRTVTKANNQALVWMKKDAAPAMVARLGDTARDTAGDPLAGVKLVKFGLFGLPDGADAGPLFTATLAGPKGGGVTPKNNFALFGVDSAGKLRQLLRTGDVPPFESSPGNTVMKTVKNFSALTGGGSPVGGRRAFTTAGSVAARAVFTDNSTGIIRVTVP